MLHPVRRYRQSAGLTIKQLAEKVGTTEANLSRIETGKQNTSIPLARALIEASGGALQPADFFDPVRSEGAA